MFIVLKIIITALIIVIITEIAKFNDRIGGLIAALPITTFLILFWLHYENNSVEKFLIMYHILFYMCFLHCQCF